MKPVKWAWKVGAFLGLLSVIAGCVFHLAGATDRAFVIVAVGSFGLGQASNGELLDRVIDLAHWFRKAAERYDTRIDKESQR